MDHFSVLGYLDTLRPSISTWRSLSQSFRSIAHTISSETSCEVVRPGEANGDVGLDDLQNACNSWDSLRLFVDTECYKRSFNDAFKERERLLACTSAISQMQRRLRFSKASLRCGRARCWDRISSQQSKQYLELVLDFEPNPDLGSDYILETLCEAEQFLAESELLRSSEANVNDTPMPPRDRRDSFFPEFQQAQSYWQQLSAYEEMLEAELQIVDLQMEQLMSVEDVLDEEERQREEDQRLFESYMTRFEWLFREAAVRLQLILEFLLLLCKSTGFPDGDRPMCMTMPWNILPALVVLWGVCWMFYYDPQDYVEPVDFQYPSLDGNTLNSTADWSQWTDPASSWGPELDDSWQNLGLDAGYPSLPALNDPAISAAIHDFAKFQGVDADTFAQIGDQYSLDRTVQSSLIDVPSNSNPTPTGGALQMQQPINGQSPIYIFEQIQRTPTEPHSAQYANTHTAQATQSTSVSVPPSGAERGHLTSRNSRNAIVCRNPQCSDLRFDELSDWKKHDEEVHNRYPCVVLDCSQSFRSKGDLRRHRQTKHDQLPHHLRLRCPMAGCRYALAPHFKRKDNLTNHLKKMHNLVHVDAKARADDSAISQARTHLDAHAEPQSTFASGSQIVFPIASPLASDSRPAVGNSPYDDLSTSQIDATISGPSKRRRLRGSSLNLEDTSTTTRASVEESHGETEEWKRKAAISEEKMEAMRVENAALRTQNELLRGEIERLKKHEDSLFALLAATRKS